MPDISDPIIKVDAISKVYKIGKKLDTSFRSTIGNIFNKNSNTKTFKALENISFELRKGEILGVIGKNGAGKSTLLKVLSKITSPTKGRIEITGRVASLLEVGTGFHPELTGRENIFLNGTILGMTKREVTEKLAEIVAFSGISEFMDTPVKRYSSGMYVRLAFAVAAHLEPEILIIDEVLAVGDYEFQKKCLGKMEEVASSGRTVIFVSHNLAAVRNLCTRAIVLNSGTVTFDGDVDGAISHYQSNAKEIESEISLTANPNIDRKDTIGDVSFSHVKYANQPFKFGEKISIEITLTSSHKKSFENLEIASSLNDKNENCLVHISNKYLGQNINHEDDKQKYTFEIENNLRPGIYKQILFLRNSDGIQDWIVDGLYLEIQDGNPYGYNNTEEIRGSILPNFTMVNSKEK
ncbi:MAG: lipopolysaccharide transport system ATP-binding protein [Ulvibacter sp.]|jgi:lipopolysaccharide transport system ATP-binding protein